LLLLCEQFRFFSEISEAVVSGKRPPVVPPKEPDPQNIFKEYAEILVSCWDNEPAKRPPFKEIARRFAAMRLKLIRPTYAPRMTVASSHPSTFTQRINPSLRSIPSSVVKVPPFAPGSPSPSPTPNSTSALTSTSSTSTSIPTPPSSLSQSSLTTSNSVSSLIATFNKQN
jgi:hypothetical protein